MWYQHLLGEGWGNYGDIIWISLLRNFSPFNDFWDEVDVSDMGVFVARALCVEGGA